VTEVSSKKGPRSKASSAKTRSLALHARYDPDRRVIAVTGADSFLGRELVGRLEEDRRVARVAAIDLRKPDIPLAKTHFHKVDLTLPTADAEVALVLKHHTVDTLVHLAFLSKPTHNTTWAHELEAIGTMHVLNACTACKVYKVVMKSLTLLYGPNPQNPNHLTEDHPMAGVPGGRFFEDKIEAERLAKRFRKENPSATVTVLRTAPILGRRIRNFVSTYLSLPVVPTLMGHDPLFQLLHEEDAVDAFKLCVDEDHDGEYNIVGPGVLPIGTLLALAGRLPLPLPRVLAQPLARAMWIAQIVDASPLYLEFLRYSCIADGEKARREMGFEPRRDIREIVEGFAFGARPGGAAAAHGERAGAGGGPHG
jgi:UDP-glucose 4-epimerase